MTDTPSAAQRLVGDIAPKLIATGAFEQLVAHVRLGRANGLTQDVIVEAVIHLAFYARWPKAMSAVGVVREVFAETDTE
jgi:4-carboxymuconolactone decarboxylase